MKNYQKNNNNNVEPQYKNVGIMRLKHYHFPTIGSTNTWAKINVEKWVDKGITLVTASEQTQGRGRFNRVWVSPKDMNIYASFCFFSDPLREDIGQIPQLLALSALEVLENYAVVSTLKWPNDLLVEGKKIAGILCETTMHQNRLGVVCGIGLNVNMTREVADQIDQPAQSLLMIKKHSFSIEEVTDKLIIQFVENWQRFLSHGFSPFFAKFQNHSHYKKGGEIYIVDGVNQFMGKFIGLNPEGSLDILLPDGQIKTCVSGEIWEQGRDFFNS